MKSLMKDLLREIRLSFGRFLSIFSIAMIGVAFFAGVSASPVDMRATAETYFDDYRYMDLHLLSPIGFNNEDVAAIRKTQGIRGFQPVHTADVLGHEEDSDNEFVVSFTSIPDRAEDCGEDYINRLRLREGRLPERPDECVLRVSTARNDPLAVGDRLIVRSGTEDPLSDLLAVSEFTIVGIAYTPVSISFALGSSTIGNGTISYLAYAPDSAFTSDIYTAAFLTAEDSVPLSSMTDEYFSAMEPLKDALAETGKERIRTRTAEFRETLQTEITRSVTEEMTKEITKEAKKAVREEIEKQVRSEIETAVHDEIEARTREVVREKAEEAIRENVLEELKEQAKQLFGPDAPESFSEAVIRGAYEPLVEAALKTTLDRAVEEAMPDALQQALNENFSGTVEELYQEKLPEVMEEKYDDAVEEAVQTALDENLESKIAEVYEEEEQIRLKDARRWKWYILDRDSMESYVSYTSAARQMSRIAAVFPVFFFFVAILVCFTTMTRMVDEQRGLIGTYKALGMSEALISVKYVLYAFTASLLGSVLGLAAGMQIFPQVIIRSWGIAYQMPEMVRGDNLLLCAVSALSMTLVVTAAAYLSCRSELGEEPAMLMRPKAPRIGRRIFLERLPFLWKHFNFALKVTARNILRYKKRFLMTLAGVAGCTALLVTGFGISDSITHMIDTQYGELYRYTATVSIPDTLKKAAQEHILSELGELEVFDTLLPVHSSSVKVSPLEKSRQNEHDAQLTVFPEEQDPSQYFLFRDVKSGETLQLPEDSLLISDHLAKDLGVKKGGRIILENREGQRIRVTVGGVLEQYVGDSVYMSAACYESLFEDTAGINTVFTAADLNKEEETALAEEIMKDPDITSVSFLTYSLTTIRNAIRALKLITVVLILSSGLLSFVVLYNLANVNISERIREIATLKVLGFYDAEVYGYLYRENIAITVIGALFGLLAGILLHHFIMGLVTMNGVIFGNYIAPLSFVYSFLLTIAFSLIVSIFVNLKLRKIPMVESLKSVE